MSTFRPENRVGVTNAPEANRAVAGTCHVEIPPRDLSQGPTVDPGTLRVWKTSPDSWLYSTPPPRTQR